MPTARERAIDATWRLLRPDLTREQFAHVVNAKPDTHGFTFNAYRTERMAVDAAEKELARWAAAESPNRVPTIISSEAWSAAGLIDQEIAHHLQRHGCTRRDNSEKVKQAVAMLVQWAINRALHREDA
jgi:hypothetical protein